MDANMYASRTIWNKNDIWVDDNMVTHCLGCNVQFNFITRKHHCRTCGNIFCSTCVSNYMVVPDFIIDKPNPNDYWNLSHYVKSLKGPKEKVCSDCFIFITGKIQSYNNIAKILDNPVSIDKIKNLSDVDVDIKSHYFDHLRNIQYYLPNHDYTQHDKKILSANASYFAGHSKYLMHLIKSINWYSKTLFISGIEKSELLNSTRNTNNIQKNSDMIMKLLSSEKHVQCSNLYCTRTCQETLSCDDCISILFTCAHVLPPDILQYVFSIISNSSDDIILNHLTFFIGLIKNNNDNKLLQTLLYNLINSSCKNIYRSFWLLNNDKKNSTNQQIMNIDLFLNLFDDELIEQMTTEYLFYAGLIENLHDPVKYLSHTFNQIKPITVPYDPSIYLLNVDLDSISIKNSYTKPVIITFETNVGHKRILFKKESIMNDVIVLNLMTICDIILKETVHQSFDAIIYPVMPLTNDSGMIELVDNSMTVHDILNSKKTILQHILETNEDKIVGHVIDKYMFSLVSYTLHSYFIGLGDRHLQNIMITDEGSIFHIDFGFILGKDSHPITFGDIKLNTGMLDVLGGQDSVKYEAYLELCADGVIVLRKYFNIFFILLCQLRNKTLDEKNIEKFILSRFQPRQSDNSVVTELLTVIRHSNDTYSDIIRDFLHYHSQEKTVQNRFGQLVNVAMSLIG
uniref:FYVE-type domain-containing protein n=1 Tax=viral metagenome TaxID=1070528 RepID=A0A6C0CC43_9ZZZZ